MTSLASLLLIALATTIGLVLTIPVVENLTQEAQGQVQEETNITQLDAIPPTIKKPEGATPSPESISNNTLSSLSVAQEQEQNEPLTQTKTNQTGGMLTYENKTLGIAFEYPVGWIVDQVDFSELSDDELSVEPVAWRSALLNKSGFDSFSDALKTNFDIQISDAPEILNPTTLQMERVSVPDWCDGLRASLSDRTVETSYDNEVYWLSNQIGKDQITKIGNQTACRIDSIALHDDIQETFDINTYLTKGDKAYMLTFSTAPKDAPTMVPLAEKMIESFRFLDNATKQ